MSFFRTLLAAAAASFALVSGALAHDGVHIVDAYARVASDVAKSGAVFFVVKNHAIVDDRLMAASTDVAERAELHTHVMDANGVMSMTAVPEGFVIPANENFALERGGAHVMLLGLTRSLKPGDTFTLTLTFEHAGVVTVEVPVNNDAATPGAGNDAMPAMDHDAMEGMDHGAMTDPAAGGHDHAAGHDHGAMVDQSGLTDHDAVVAVLKAAFDTPENPLTVDPVVVEGGHALASWAQGDKGGRALLEKREGGWAVVLCGGPDLRMPAFLAGHGVSAADRLSAMFNSAEDALGADKVSLASSFEGVVMIDGGDH